MSRERGESGDDFSPHPKRGHRVRDALLGVGNHAENGVAHLSERRPFRLVEAFQIDVNLVA
jgi:hypothetical protein